MRFSDRAGRGHAEALLVAPAVGVLVQVAGRLVGAGEPGPDHHRAGAGGQRQRHVPGVPHSAVGPHVAAGVAGGGRALEHGRELRASHAGHHPCRAHRARAHADLDDVGAGGDQLAGALGGDHVAGDDRHVRGQGPDRAQRLDHPLLVAVRGVDDQRVHPGVEDGLGLAGDVAVDPDGRGDRESAAAVERRAGRRSRAARRCGSARRPAAPSSSTTGATRRRTSTRRSKASRGRQPLRQRHRLGRHDLVHLGEAVHPAAVVLGHDPDGPTVDDDEGGAMGALGDQGQRIGDGVVGRQRDGGVDDEVLALDVGDHVGDDVGAGCPAGSPTARRGAPPSRPSGGPRSRSCSPPPAGASRRWRRRWRGPRRRGSRRRSAAAP